jgi:hypothetical protein
MTAWFFQYSVMGVAFPSIQTLGQLFWSSTNVLWREELMEPHVPVANEPLNYQLRYDQTIMSPMLMTWNLEGLQSGPALLWTHQVCGDDEGRA